MPVEFLTDDEAAAFGRYVGTVSQGDLERVFFLDDEDRALVDRRRGDHMKLGFSLQLVTVRWLGTFLEDPLDVPVAVLDFVAEQLGMGDASLVKRYTERAKTKLDHQREIRQVYGLREFSAAEAELRAWVAARSWTTGDGPKAIFTDAAGWLRERQVLLPGVSTLARLVAQVRDDTTRPVVRCAGGAADGGAAVRAGSALGGAVELAGVGPGAVAQGPGASASLRLHSGDRQINIRQEGHPVRLVRGTPGHRGPGEGQPGQPRDQQLADIRRIYGPEKEALGVLAIEIELVTSPAT